MVMVIGAMVASGCKGRGSAPAPAHTDAPRRIRPIAVVEVEQIIQAMGWSTEIRAAVSIAQRQLRADRDRQLKDLYQQGMAVRKRIAKSAKLNAAQTDRVLNLQNPGQLDTLPLTPAQRKELIDSGIQINRQAEQVQQQYMKDLDNQSIQIAGSYRGKIVPAAKRVAAVTGFRTIIVDASSVIYHDPSTDVTQQVIDEMKSDRPRWEQAGTEKK